MHCGRCQSTAVVAEEVDYRCDGCGARLASRGAMALLPALAIAAIALFVPGPSWLLIAMLPALIWSLVWSDGLRPIAHPTAPPPLPAAKISA